ncbi:fgf-3 [Clostera anastomosis granulovirus B]|uniref:Fgf-3 n=1 Tax=Clostera anastomosis granulovirus B TaxID=1986290 RepID=A0A0K0WSC6_9BBAC|nr:fgf-3 [Clostera anastomosis granulovirus B]AKS25464.1 fgf-3 [Clostera anastomosis granulovirus B]
MTRIVLFLCCSVIVVVSSTATDFLKKELKELNSLEGSGGGIEEDFLTNKIEYTVGENRTIDVKPTVDVNSTIDVMPTVDVVPTDIVNSTISVKPTIDVKPITIESTTKKSNEDTGEVYKSDKKIVQLYQVIDETRVYLDGSNNQVGQYIVTDMYAHQFLNFIHYTLYSNTKWDTNDQIVLRHQLSLYYFCLTNCAVVYMSSRLTRDCIFKRELAQDITATLETIYLRKQIPDGPLLTLNMDYGSVNFKNHSTFYVEEKNIIWDDNMYELSPVVDEANTDVCVNDLDDITAATAAYTDDFDNKTVVDNVNTAAANLTILIVCLTVIILIVGVLLVTVYLYKHKKYRLKNIKQ